MEILTVELEVLSPLFMGGADQTAEVRPSSLKGLLRFWYRAVDPLFREREEQLFGGAGGGAGQSPFLLRVSQGFRTMGWNSINLRRFDEGKGPKTRNGIRYLGYPFALGNNRDRTAIAPGQLITARCVLPRPSSEPLRRALVASWWLLGNLGGGGSRARRGFGSLALRGWNMQGDRDWPELNELPGLWDATTPAEWNVRFSDALSVLDRWFGPWPPSRDLHPHLGDEFIAVLLPRASGEWTDALNHVGRRLQDFRMRAEPDYSAVKAHVRRERSLDRTPERATFGLPLTFRFGGSRTVNFLPHGGENSKGLDRHGSLLLIRLVSLKDNLYPLFVRMDGAVPGSNPPAVLDRAARALRRPNNSAMDDFVNSLREG